MTDRSEMHAAFRLNLEQQKNRAKDLLRAAKAEDTSALARLKLVRSNAQETRGSTIKLADAQFIIAQELRFSSWPKLKAHIVAMDKERTAMCDSRQPLDGDLKTLHIRCGSDIKQTLIEADFSGDFLEHSYPYCQGPVTNAPDRIEQQARFVADAYGKYMNFSFADALARAQEGERRLTASADDYERIVLWVEHDSYDQLMLIRCLAHYASAKTPRVLELIAIDHFPGSERFIGLGQLPAEALRLLWGQRQSVTAAQSILATDTWQALLSDNPKKLVAIMRSGAPALPNLSPALQRHLQELPSIENGLRLTERIILEILSQQSDSINRVWHLYSEREPLPWLGDLMFLHLLDCMEQATEKVFVRDRGAPGRNGFRDQLTITETGRSVLRGERDWLSLQPPTRWVGGVQIRSDVSNWRWNEAKQEVVLI